MTVKDIKEEARKKLALNMHQAVIVYTVQFTLMITLIALIVMSCVGLESMLPAAIVMLCYGVVLAFIAIVGIGMINFCMVDFYLASYRCKPYNVRRLGETLARSNITKIFLLSLKRALFSFLLLLCLIVPGVIYMIRTSMANYLLIANPKMTAKTALSASNKVMSGKTGSYFVLCMSLLGWYLLGLLTLGLGFIFILPYTNLIKVVYYKRNLQGDKAVYVVPPQPVSPMPDTAVQTTTVQQQSIPVNNPSPVAAQPPEKVVMPIDTLEAEDYRDMNETMSGFNSAERVEDVPEVPIMPIKNNKTHATVQSEPIAKPKVKSKSIDGTNLVESERILTTIELEDNAEAQQQAIDDMYNHTNSNTPVRDYFSGGGRQSPNDFMTEEIDFDDPQAVSEPPAENVIDGAADGGVISDEDFDAFLRDFDNAVVEEAQAEAVVTDDDTAAPPVKPDSQASRVTPRGGARPIPERRSSTERTPRRTGERNAHSIERNKEIQDRAERLKREREERLSRLKK